MNSTMRKSLRARTYTHGQSISGAIFHFGYDRHTTHSTSFFFSFVVVVVGVFFHAEVWILSITEKKQQQNVQSKQVRVMISLVWLLDKFRVWVCVALWQRWQPISQLIFVSISFYTKKGNLPKKNMQFTHTHFYHCELDVGIFVSNYKHCRIIHDPFATWRVE